MFGAANNLSKCHLLIKRQTAIICVIGVNIRFTVVGTVTSRIFNAIFCCVVQNIAEILMSIHKQDRHVKMLCGKFLSKRRQLSIE